MSRFEKLAHVIWHCQYHIVWVPKYRYRVLRDRIKEEVRKTLIIQSERLGCTIVELNIQEDHIHLLIKVPPKIAISVLMGTLKGKTAIRVFNRFPELKQRPYWGNHFRGLRVLKAALAPKTISSLQIPLLQPQHVICKIWLIKRYSFKQE